MLSFRSVGLIILILTGFGFASGFFHLNPDNTACIDGKTWRSTSWHTIFAVSKFEIRYRDWNYDCRGEKYDKGQFHTYP